MDPIIIQGGMGVGVSNWRLARAVGLCGQLGVVSGTCSDTILVRRLQDGDSGGEVRRALEAFPLVEHVKTLIDKYFLPEGRGPDVPYKALTLHQVSNSIFRDAVTMMGSFVEVFLAKLDNVSPVGINLLTKIQLPTLPALYGAMLAGVDYVLMGAGIPKEVPAALDSFAEGNKATLKLDSVSGVDLEFEPAHFFGGAAPALKRPKFFPIVSTHSLAAMLAKKSRGRVDGFVVEGPQSGGHNAPPRDSGKFNERGEPVYGERDQVSTEKMCEIGLPFWLAGGYGSPEGVQAALQAGAKGVQVGSLFALCAESGILSSIKSKALAKIVQGEADVRTDGRASPTGFPFKVLQLEDTLSEDAVFEKRDRICDLGYLRTAYAKEDGGIGFRCPSEPVDIYVKKGGPIEDTESRKCLCNCLLSTVGLGQLRSRYLEPAMLTAGDQIKRIADMLRPGQLSYTAKDVVTFLLSKLSSGQAAPR